MPMAGEGGGPLLGRRPDRCTEPRRSVHPQQHQPGPGLFRVDHDSTGRRRVSAHHSRSEEVDREAVAGPLGGRCGGGLLDLDLISSQDEDARSGAGDDRGQAGRAQPRDQVGASPAAPAARYCWCRRSSVAASSASSGASSAPSRSAAATSSALRAAVNAASACGTVRRQQRRARACVDDSNGGTSDDRTNRAGRPSTRRRASRRRLGPRDRQAAVQAGGDVVGVALDRGRERERGRVGQRCVATDDQRAGERRRRRRSRPPTSRARARAGSGSRTTVRARAAGRRAGRRSRASPAPPGAISSRGSVLALAGDVDAQAAVDDAGDDVVVQAQRQAEAVEARAEVRAGGGHPHVHRAGAERGFIARPQSSPRLHRGGVRRRPGR